MKMTGQMLNAETTMYFVRDIVVPHGRRKVNEGRVKELAESIAEIGQLQPIVVVEDPENERAQLVAGAHRLSAFKMLGIDRINTMIVKLSEIDVKLVEIDENLIRSELTAAERAKLTAERRKLYLAKYPETGKGKSKGALGSGKGGKATTKSAKLAVLPSFAEDTSKKSGKSKRSVERDSLRGEKIDSKVLDDISGTELDTGVNLDVLSKLDANQQKELVGFAAKSGVDNLKTAQRNMAKEKVVQEIAEEPQPLPEGPFRVIAADPPWPYDRVDVTHRGSITYPPMSISEICDLEVEGLAHDDSILFLWTTNSFIHDACHVVKAWGFEQKTILTWCKSKFGVGNWLRNQTEHCILAVRGKPVVTLTNQSTILKGGVREHSRKPESFYELVDSLCPGSKVELFSRFERDGWVPWGAEKNKFDSDKEKE